MLVCPRRWVDSQAQLDEDGDWPAGQLAQRRRSMEANSGGSTPVPAGAAATAAPAVELDEEAKALQLEATKAVSRKSIAEAEKGVVEAQRDAFSAALPSVDTKALEGGITLGDKVGMVSDRIAHQLVSDAAGRVAEALGKALDANSRVLLVDDRDLVSSDWAYEFAKLQLEAYVDALGQAKEIVTKATPTPDGKPTAVSAEQLEALAASVRSAQSQLALGAPLVAPGLTVAKSLIGAAADVASFFRSDFSIKARDVAVGATPLAAAICERLSEQAAIEVDRLLRLDGKTGILAQFRGALDARMKLKRLSAILKARVVDPSTRELEALRAELTSKSTAKNAEKDADRRKELGEEELELRRKIASAETNAGPAAGAVASADALVSGFDGLAEKLTGSPEGGGLPPLGVAAIRERLHVGEKPYTHVLFAGVESTGGESIARKSIWPWWNTLTFLGGAQLSYLLVDVRENTVKAAGTESLLARMKLNLSTGFTGKPEGVKA
jgi:hypothetical protein